MYTENNIILCKKELRVQNLPDSKKKNKKVYEIQRSKL